MPECWCAKLISGHLFLPVAEPEAEAFCSLREPEEAEPEAEEPPAPPVVESEAGTLQEPVVKLMVMPGPARQLMSFSGDASDTSGDQEEAEAHAQQVHEQSPSESEDDLQQSLHSILDNLSTNMTAISTANHEIFTHEQKTYGRCAHDHCSAFCCPRSRYAVLNGRVGASGE